MNAKREFTPIVVPMIVLTIVGIVILVLANIRGNPWPVKSDQMRNYVNTLYQPKGEVRISCAGQRCTAVFANQQEQEKTVVADCYQKGCSEVVPRER